MVHKFRFTAVSHDEAFLTVVLKGDSLLNVCFISEC